MAAIEAVEFRANLVRRAGVRGAVYSDLQNTIAKRSLRDCVLSILPLTPRHPREPIQRYERCGVRAIILPCRVGGIAGKVSRTPPVTFAQRANALEILERSRLGQGDLISVDIKCCHAALQKVSSSRTKPRKRA
jgi:hypothetical protein